MKHAGTYRKTTGQTLIFTNMKGQRFITRDLEKGIEWLKTYREKQRERKVQQSPALS